MPDVTTRQFLACTYRPGDTRRYTFHNDREPVAVGDRVVISGKNAPQVITVAEILLIEPAFETKPIVGKERPLDEPIPAEAA